ncbi:MAG: ribbon-helix-helix protein, CopG family [Actinobacteria bacterium]|nr:ribbon-helix-helix protein, CopG family [Actinomycetota bacterium]
MSVTLDLPDEMLAALQAEAERRQMTVEELIAESVSEHVGAAPRRRQFALAGVGSSTGIRFARDADELLAEGFGRD